MNIFTHAKFLPIICHQIWRYQVWGQCFSDQLLYNFLSRPLVNEANPCMDLKLKQSSRDLVKIAVSEQRPFCGSLCNRSCKCFCPQNEILLVLSKYTITTVPQTDAHWGTSRNTLTLSVYCMYWVCTFILLRAGGLRDTHVQDRRGARPAVQLTDAVQRIPLHVVLTLIHTRQLTQTHSNSRRIHHN